MSFGTDIDFCIPAIGAGACYLEYLISNLKRTARYPERIRIFVSYHTDEDRAQIEALSCAENIHEFVKVQTTNSVIFPASSRHSSAINGLAEKCSSDIIVFCDYDMAFLMPDWDLVISRRLCLEGVDIFGVPYPNLVLSNKFDKFGPLGWLNNVPLVKYQGIPNLSFLAMRRDLINSCFLDSKITLFDRYLAEGNIPFRIISTQALAIQNRIPIGNVQWLDTGYEIPEIVERFGLRHEVLSYRRLADQAVFAVVEPFMQLDPGRQPEFFYHGLRPFICHFKKGSQKAQNGTSQELFDLFISNVERSLGG